LPWQPDAAERAHGFPLPMQIGLSGAGYLRWSAGAHTARRGPVGVRGRLRDSGDGALQPLGCGSSEAAGGWRRAEADGHRPRTWSHTGAADDPALRFWNARRAIRSGRGRGRTARGCGVWGGEG